MTMSDAPVRPTSGRPKPSTFGLNAKKNMVIPYRIQISQISQVSMVAAGPNTTR